MITLMQQAREFSDTLAAIDRTANAVAGASLPELREEIDATYVLIVGQFIPKAQGEVRANSARLTEKLMALRERLWYSDFGPAERSAVRGVLADLHEVIELQAF